MKPVTQTITEPGLGNCFAACLASLLEVPCDSVPNSPDDDEWLEKLNHWLRGTHQHVLIRVAPDSSLIGRYIPFIASVDGPRGRRHAVLGFYGSKAQFCVWHDPHPDAGGPISEPHCLYFLIALPHELAESYRKLIGLA